MLPAKPHRGRKIYTLDDLRTELRWLRLFRMLWLIPASLNIGAVIIALRNHTFEAGLEWKVSVGLGLASIPFMIIIASLGSSKLMVAVREVHPQPTGDWVAVLIRSLSYRGARNAAWEKLAELLPYIGPDEALHVHPRLCESLYKQSEFMAAHYRQSVFDAAVRFQDRRAIRYMRKLLTSSTIPEEERVRILANLNTLSGSAER